MTMEQTRLEFKTKLPYIELIFMSAVLYLEFQYKNMGGETEKRSSEAGRAGASGRLEQQGIYCSSTSNTR